MAMAIAATRMQKFKIRLGKFPNLVIWPTVVFATTKEEEGDAKNVQIQHKIIIMEVSYRKVGLT